MSTEILNVTPSDVTFVQKIRQREVSTIFQVTVRGKECVMKVTSDGYLQYHEFVRPEAESKHIEHSRFKCESKAYRRLKAEGLCDDGSIPQFFGTIEQMQPSLWEPHLDMFLEDEMWPNAIIIEYIPGMHMMDLSTFSMAGMGELVHILQKIHSARVVHMDPYPRNMMVVPGNPDRILWIDFDIAQTLSASPTPKQQEWIDEELEMMDYFANALAQDHKEGKIKESWDYFFEGLRPGSHDYSDDIAADSERMP